MSDDPNRPVVLTTVPNEAQAAILVAVLDEHGVPAQATGALTSAFRAEVPGAVRIMVRQADLSRAQEALQAVQGRATRSGDEVPGPDSV